MAPPSETDYDRMTGGENPGVHDLAHGNRVHRIGLLAGFFQGVPEVVRFGVAVAVLLQIDGNALAEVFCTDEFVQLIKHAAALLVS